MRQGYSFLGFNGNPKKFAKRTFDTRSLYLLFYHQEKNKLFSAIY
jgi:hypothetical protein